MGPDLRGTRYFSGEGGSYLRGGYESFSGRAGIPLVWSPFAATAAVGVAELRDSAAGRLWVNAMSRASTAKAKKNAALCGGTPLGFGEFSRGLPRVASRLAGQPWALWRNPFGIERRLNTEH